MKKIEIGKAIGYGWESIKKNFWYLIAITVIYYAVAGISGVDRNENSGASLLSILIWLLSIYMMGGLLRILLDYYDGKKRPISDLFTQVKYFWRLLGATLLVSLIVFVGFILLVVPGIYWALKYQFVPYLIVDKDMNVMEAMKQSGNMTLGVKWQLLGFAFVSLGIIILGAIALGVGIFVAAPIIMLAEIFIYRHLLTQSKE
ncbi:MAG: YciC family protein [Patescibacteria group bacterium]